MARVTIEDCLGNVDNRFQLVMVAAKRARELARGADPKVEWDNDKVTVVALREIAGGLIGPDILQKPEEPQEQFRAPSVVEEPMGHAAPATGDDF